MLELLYSCGIRRRELAEMKLYSFDQSAEIGKKGSCHMFRHTMATLMLENGADIRYIQAMLCHADLRTTQIYTQVSIRKLQQVHKLTPPADLPPTEAGADRPEAGGKSQPEASASEPTRENPSDSEPK